MKTSSDRNILLLKRTLYVATSGALIAIFVDSLVVYCRKTERIREFTILAQSFMAGVEAGSKNGQNDRSEGSQDAQEGDKTDREKNRGRDPDQEKVGVGAEGDPTIDAGTEAGAGGTAENR